jgi:putative ABC transport system permease protein
MSGYSGHRATPAVITNVLVEGGVIEILRDIRAGGRLLLKSPSYAAVVVLTLALAIGANTIIFSFADLFLLRPLPLGDPARTVTLYSVDTQRGIQRARTSLPDFLDWRAGTAAFEEMAAYHQASFTLTGSGDPLPVTALLATANMPAMWRLKTVAGRTLLPGEDAPGAPKVAVLSHRFWKEHFSSDPNVVGRSLMLNGEAYTVVGILTDEIEIGSMIAIDLWMALPVEAPAPRATLECSRCRRD